MIGCVAGDDTLLVIAEQRGGAAVTQQLQDLAGLT